MKIVFDIDPEELDVDAFFWDGDEEPPPIVRPKRKNQDSKEKIEKEGKEE